MIDLKSQIESDLKGFGLNLNNIQGKIRGTDNECHAPLRNRLIKTYINKGYSVHDLSEVIKLDYYLIGYLYKTRIEHPKVKPLDKEMEMRIKRYLKIEHVK
jgi:hypothetical protein